MSEKKTDPNIFEKIREEQRKKQREEVERKQRIAEVFNQQDTNPLDRLRGVKR